MHIYNTLKTINGKSLIYCQNRANSKPFYAIYDKKTFEQDYFGEYNKKGVWVCAPVRNVKLTKKEEQVFLEYIKNL